MVEASAADASAEIVVVNRYALRDAPAFRSAATALATRVSMQGHPGVLGYRFHCPDQATGWAVVRYADATAWIGHHDLVMAWPEMAALRAAADLDEVLLAGEPTAGMQDWIDRLTLRPRLRSLGHPVAGFQR